MSQARESVPPLMAKSRTRGGRRAENAVPRAVDLTGRERQLRAAMQAMGQVAARFCRAARRTLPFLVRQRSRLLPQPVSIINPAEDGPEQESGPTFVVLLEAEELPAWASLTLDTVALRLVLEGSLGAREPGTGELGLELTLAQRALVARVARSLADDFIHAVREQVGLGFSIVSAHAVTAEEGVESPGDDGLRVDCVFDNIPGEPAVTLAVSAEALETAVREQHEDAPVTADPRMAEALREVVIEVVVELGSAQLSLREIMGLKAGQVIRLATAVDDPVQVRVEGSGKLLGRPVVSRGQLAVEIRRRYEE